MKKFWIVLLALGLVAGFAMSASAADVKFSGSYYVGGLYADKPMLNADKVTGSGDLAFYFQRLRIQTEFKVAEGLSLVTRFDALERRWGDNRWSGTEDTYNRRQGQTAFTGTAANTAVQIQENIEFERAYLDFNTKIGKFQIGYQNFVSWGTDVFNTNLTRAGIKYIVPIGPLTVIAAIEKGAGKDNNLALGSATEDADQQIYDLGVIYKFGAGDAGIIFQKSIDKSARATTNQYHDLLLSMAYARVKFGPIYFEAEGLVGFGDMIKKDGTGPIPLAVNSGIEQTALAWGLYLHGKGDFGPAYAGGRFLWISGDDRTTLDKREGNLAAPLKAGDAFNPCLIMWNDQYTKWVGDIAASNSAANGGQIQETYMDNVWFYQVYAGIKPVKDLDILASVSYATADKSPYVMVPGAGTVGAKEYLSKTYGTEIDLTVKYMVYDNLEYMIGAAYLITGDLFKGINPNFSVANNYLIMHKLTLNF